MTNYNNFVHLQGRIEIVTSTMVPAGRSGERVLQIDGYVHTAAVAVGGQHPIRLMGQPASVVQDWLTRHQVSVWPEVIIEGKFFSPPEGKSLVLIEFIRFVGTTDLASRSGNFPSRPMGYANRGRKGS